jgi:uncharacterized protein YndB with AHSA1/START domain
VFVSPISHDEFTRKRMMSKPTVAQDAVVIERTFDAPVDLIWQMWTEPDHFAGWYGPTGFTVPVAEMDLHVGGKRLVCMASPDGSMKMWTVGEYVEIRPATRLVYTESLADENGNPVPPSTMGMPEGYPATTEVTVVLEDLGGRTNMVMTHAGVPADSGAAGGWNQAFDKLAERAAILLDD